MPAVNDGMGIDISNLVALFLQSILYGIYIVTCWNCAGALTRTNGGWRSRKEIHWLFVVAGTFLLINTTCNVCLQFYKCLQLLVYRAPAATNWIIVVKVCHDVQWSQKHVLIIISLFNSFSNRLWETSFLSTESLLCIRGTGRLLYHLLSCGLSTPVSRVILCNFKLQVLATTR